MFTGFNLINYYKKLGLQLPLYTIKEHGHASCKRGHQGFTTPIR